MIFKDYFFLKGRLGEGEDERKWIFHLLFHSSNACNRWNQEARVQPCIFHMGARSSSTQAITCHVPARPLAENRESILTAVPKVHASSPYFVTLGTYVSVSPSKAQGQWLITSRKDTDSSWRWITGCFMVVAWSLWTPPRSPGRHPLHPNPQLLQFNSPNFCFIITREGKGVKWAFTFLFTSFYVCCTGMRRKEKWYMDEGRCTATSWFNHPTCLHIYSIHCTS